MEGIITGVGVGGVMLAINAVVCAVRDGKKRARREAAVTQENQEKIAQLERELEETKQLIKLTLSACIILGDGMVQNGINGEFKKAFGRFKQDAVKML